MWILYINNKIKRVLIDTKFQKLKCHFLKKNSQKLTKMNINRYLASSQHLRSWIIIVQQYDTQFETINCWNFLLKIKVFFLYISSLNTEFDNAILNVTTNRNSQCKTNIIHLTLNSYPMIKFCSFFRLATTALFHKCMVFSQTILLFISQILFSLENLYSNR